MSAASMILSLLISNLYSLHAMTIDLDIHTSRQSQRIEVLGLLDTRTLAEDSFPEIKPFVAFF